MVANHASDNQTVVPLSSDGASTVPTHPGPFNRQFNPGNRHQVVTRSVVQLLAPKRVRTVIIEAQGQLLKMHDKTAGPSHVAVGQSVRGIIRGFSQKSRKRMIDQLARIDWNKVKGTKHKPVFVTLTYPHNQQDHQAAARDIDALAKRMQRRCPECSFVWRKEVQERGAIHYHLIVFGFRWMSANGKRRGGTTWQDWWCEITNTTARNSCDVTRIRSINGVVWYCAKYMAKEDANVTDSRKNVINPGSVTYSLCGNPQLRPPVSLDRTMGLSILHTSPRENESSGRWWGVRGRKYLPVGDLLLVEHVVPDWLLRDWTLKLESTYATHECSFTLYRPFAAIWGQELLHMTLSMSKRQKTQHRANVARLRQNRRAHMRTWWRRRASFIALQRHMSPEAAAYLS